MEVFNNFLEGVKLLDLNPTIMQEFAYLRGNLRAGPINWRSRSFDCSDRDPSRSNFIDQQPFSLPTHPWPHPYPRVLISETILTTICCYAWA
jgi:hypothetical protein